MTRKTPPPEDAQGSWSALPRDASNGPSITLHPSVELNSDNDAREKDAREQLKKTSIASLSKHATQNQNITSTPDDILMSMSGSTQKDQSPEKEDSRPGSDTTRGRPVRKRSFDDLEAADAEINQREASEKREDKWSGHIRKRSRDVRAGEPLKEDGRSRGITIPVEEEAEDAVNDKESHEAMDSNVQTVGNATEATETHSDAEIEGDGNEKAVREPTRPETGGTTNPTAPEVDKELIDQEMRDSTASPRKKRSRDQFDSDPDREQKIAATKETRAHRRSDEIERAKNSGPNDQPPLQHDLPSSTHTELVATRMGPKASTAEAETKQAPSVFGSTSKLSPLPTPTRSKSLAKSSSENTSTIPDLQSQTSASAFASSGFAKLSNSATSPFSSLGAASTAGSTSSPFASASPFTPRKADSDVPRTTETAANGGFGAFTGPTASGFGATEPSPFGTAGAAKSSIFGGTVLGSGFGGGFGGGGRLANFAAPAGDAKLGAANGSIKPIGSPTREGDDDEDSESDGEGFGGSAREGNDEGNERFQHQDGKQCPLHLGSP